MEAYTSEQETPITSHPGTGRSHRSGRILVAEDDVRMRRLVATILRDSGYRVVEACDGAEILERVESTIWADRHELFGAIVSDMNMPALTGLDVLAALRCTAIDTPFILITAFGDADVRAEATALGAAAVLDKPIDLAALQCAVRAALHGGLAGGATIGRPPPRIVRRDRLRRQ